MHSSFKHMLQQQLKKLGVTRDGGPQHGYGDVVLQLFYLL